MKSIGFKLTAIMLAVILIGIAGTVGVSMYIASGIITRGTIEEVHQNTLYNKEALNNWLYIQETNINALAAVMGYNDELAAILTSDRTDDSGRLEAEVANMLRPSLKAVLDNNDAQFEVYMGFIDGSAVAGSGYEFDYSWWKAYERGWYKMALTDTSRAHITLPYIDAQTGELCVSTVRAVLHHGDLMGVIAADIFITDLLKITLEAAANYDGYGFLVSSGGEILIHPDADFAPDAEGNFKDITTIKDGVFANLWRDISASDGTYKYKNASGTVNYYNAAELEATGWHMVTVLPEKVVTQPIKNLFIIVIPLAIVALLIAAVLIFMITKNTITKPLTLLAAFMKKAGSTGDLTLTSADIDSINKLAKSEDEIGQAIAGSALFVQHVTSVADDLEVIANSDLNIEIELLSDSDMMGKSMKQMVDNLNNMFAEIQASTGQVSTGSKQVADGAQSLAQGATEQAASIEELSSSIAEVAERTKENATIADKTSRLSETIKGNAEKGSQQMDDMITAVGEINEASKNISKIIKTIDDIAFQTNILALNAAVEAARAGQHGKGFAVVAEEVRNLASKSAEAAKDTGDMIQNSMEKAEFGARIAGETAASLKEIVSGINESSHLIEEIAKSSENQSSGISQINIGIDQVAQVVQQNSATAEESAAASEEMSSQADILQQLIARFKLKGGSGVYHGLSQTVKPAQKHTAKPAQPAAAPADFSMDFDKY